MIRQYSVIASSLLLASLLLGDSCLNLQCFNIFLRLSLHKYNIIIKKNSNGITSKTKAIVITKDESESSNKSNAVINMIKYNTTPSSLFRASLLYGLIIRCTYQGYYPATSNE